MEGTHELLVPGLRGVEAGAGRSASQGFDATLFQGHAALLVVDLEMSGPDARQHEVLDVGGIRVTLEAGFPEEEAWGARVRPRHIGTANEGALKVVGYSSRAWRDAIELEAAFERLSELGRGGVIAGWGIGQDLAFITEGIRRVGIEWPFAPFALDIQVVARRVLKNTGHVDRFNLGHVADRLGIGRMGEHSALADAYATYDVLVKLVEIALPSPENAA